MGQASFAASDSTIMEVAVTTSAADSWRCDALVVASGGVFLDFAASKMAFFSFISSLDHASRSSSLAKNPRSIDRDQENVT